MPFFFVCLYLHNVRSYMAKIFRDEIKSPFAFSHIFLRATRWCWWRQYKNIQSLLGDVVARENIYQSASTWSCWPIINSQCWNVHFFFHSSCAAPKPSQKTVFDSISLFILSHSGMKISRPEKLAEAFQGKNWNSSEISIFHGVPFFVYPIKNISRICTICKWPFPRVMPTDGQLAKDKSQRVFLDKGNL